MATGKKSYDIIRFFESVGHFYSQKIIDILSQYIDMSDKCYPIYIKDVDTQYYILYNLKAYTWYNNRMYLDKDDPRYYDIQNASKYIYAIGGTLNIIVNEEVK